MKTWTIYPLLLAVALAGCVNVPEKIDVNFNNGGSRQQDQAAPASRDPQAPSQIPSVQGGSWREIATNVAGQVFLAAENGVLFYAFDTLAYPGEPVDLTIRLQSIDNFKDIKGATIGFYDADELLGSAETDDGGLAALSWTPPAVGNYALTARIDALPDGVDEEVLRVTPAPLLVAARDKQTQFVVIDLDHTVVASSFFRVLIGGARPMAESVDVTQRIASVYSIIYLTHRPDLMTRKSKGWLSDNGYPTGPLLVSELKQAFGDSGTFKTAKLKNLRKAFPNVRIGIGDKLSDAQAYVDNGLTAYLIPHYKEKPKNMRKMAKEIRRLRSRDRLHAVDGWREVEAGVFKGRSFPPATFARRLDRRADQLQADQDRRKRHRDDDDDDDDDEKDDD